MLGLIDDIQDPDKKGNYYEKWLEITKQEKLLGEPEVKNSKLFKQVEIRNVGFSIQDKVNHIIQSKGKLVTIPMLHIYSTLSH